MKTVSKFERGKFRQIFEGNKTPMKSIKITCSNFETRFEAVSRPRFNPRIRSIRTLEPAETRARGLFIRGILLFFPCA